MPSLNVDSDFFTHIKTKRLKANLGNGAEILPIKLWNICAKYYPTGKMGNLTQVELEEMLEWDASKGQAIPALKKAGFLKGESGNYQCHEFKEHQGHILAYHLRGQKGAEKRWGKMLQASVSNASSNAKIKTSNASSNAKIKTSNASSNAPTYLHTILTTPTMPTILPTKKTSKEGDGVAKATPLRDSPKENELKPSFHSLGPLSAPMPKDSPPPEAPTAPIAPTEPTLVAVKAPAGVSKTSPASAASPLKPSSPDGWPEFVGWLKEKWRDFQGVPLMFEGKQAKIILAAYKVYGFEVCKAAWYKFLQSEDEYDAKAGYSVERWRYRLPGLLEELRKEGKLNGTSGPKGTNGAVAAPNQTNSGISDFVGKGKGG